MKENIKESIQFIMHIPAFGSSLVQHAQNLASHVTLEHYSEANPNATEIANSLLHVCMELSGTISEYRSMPCKSLEERMFATESRYRNRITDARDSLSNPASASPQVTDEQIDKLIESKNWCLEPQEFAEMQNLCRDAIALSSPPAAAPSFEKVWKETGYQYGAGALENVRLGWHLRSKAAAPQESKPVAAKLVPLKEINELVGQAMEQASNNGANSISMPDEYVAIAHFCCYPEQYGLAAPQEEAQRGNMLVAMHNGEEWAWDESEKMIAAQADAQSQPQEVMGEQS